MGPGYRCTHYELLPCDRELQILSTIPQVVEPSTVSLRGVSTNWCANLYILFCLLERLTWTENAGPEESGYGFSKTKVGCKPCFEGKPAQVSTVRTEKLVFSLNYERLGNRANVAGTGTSLCRLIGEWNIGSRTSLK
jgi:hypothetical protein